MSNLFKISDFFSLLKITAILKNILIAIPLILIETNVFNETSKIFLGVLVFFLISTVCFFTNYSFARCFEYRKKQGMEKRVIPLARFP